MICERIHWSGAFLVFLLYPAVLRTSSNDSQLSLDYECAKTAMPNQISPSLCCRSIRTHPTKSFYLYDKKSYTFSVLLFITSLLNAPNILSLDLRYHHLVLHPSTHSSISSVNPSIYISSTHSCWWTSAMLGISHCCHLQEK